MVDLIYLSHEGDYAELRAEIQRAFPHAKLADASDDIHPHRFEVALPDEERDGFYKFLIREGFALASLGIQMLMRVEPERLTRLMDECGIGAAEGKP